MRPFFGAALDGFIGNEPGVAAATAVTPPRMRPARDVALVRVGHTEREPIDRCFAFGVR